jgi:hypothetical protein
VVGKVLVVELAAPQVLHKLVILQHQQAAVVQEADLVARVVAAQQVQVVLTPEQQVATVVQVQHRQSQVAV